MKTFIPLFPASPSRNPHDERRKALLQRILAQQAQIEDLIRDNQTANPGLAARARSLLLFHKGASMENIMRVTGLSQNTVLRVRRRFELWGAACIAEPQPLPPARTAPVLSVRV